MGFFTFLGITVILAFTFYGLYTYVTKQDKDDNK